MSVWRRVRYWLYVGHRWFGIAACLMFVIWFASGLVMSYVVFPEADEQRRVEALEPIDWSAIRIGPTEALTAASLQRYPRELRVEMLMHEPVYRIVQWDGTHRTLSATSGAPVGRIPPDRAVAIAEQYAGERGHWETTLKRDQWTVPESYGPFRPLHKIAIEDAAGTRVYVSALTGEVVLSTTRRQRFWNWLGSIPHWIYLTPLRADQPAWRQVNLWVSGPAILIAVSGIWIGVLRLRVRGRYPHGGASPYHGWKSWHHWCGLLGGVFVLTWIVSGWLSVDPNHWLRGGSLGARSLLEYAGESAPRFDADLRRLSMHIPPETRAVSFVYFDGRPLVSMVGGIGPRLFDARSGERAVLTDPQIFAAARRLMPAHDMVERERIETDDLYWYSHHEHRELPVLRVGFDDPARSWVYLEPATGAVLGYMDRAARRNRWWFNALHRWDFNWLLKTSLIWHSAIWILSVLGLVTSASGVVIGYRRLRRKLHSRSQVRLEPFAP